MIKILMLLRRYHEQADELVDKAKKEAEKGTQDATEASKPKKNTKKMPYNCTLLLVLNM